MKLLIQGSLKGNIQRATRSNDQAVIKNSPAQSNVYISCIDVKTIAGISLKKISIIHGATEYNFQLIIFKYLGQYIAELLVEFIK